LNACISGALWRDPSGEGAVLLRADKCIGCWTCIMMCPYGVVGQQRDGRRLAIKCDRCPDAVRPACVASCPTRALEDQEVAAFAKEQRESFAASVAAKGG
jgi:carbon-monoxide dehydrogenase iron sulfur subunit